MGVLFAYSCGFQAFFMLDRTSKIHDLQAGIDKDFYFIVLIKFISDFWVFINWFYVGCKKKAKKNSSLEE